MPVIKQTAAVKGVPSSYRLNRVDGQVPKPYPLWSYTWELPPGVDAEFKSVNTGYPMVIVQWNQVSTPGRPFPLKCIVTTDATDAHGARCTITSIIDVNVGEEVVNLTSQIWGPTGACIKENNGDGTYYTYYGRTPGAKEAIWNGVRAKFLINNEWVSGPIVVSNLPSDGYSSVNVLWSRATGNNNISLYGMDASGNSSPNVIYPTYPMPQIDNNSIITGIGIIDGKPVKVDSEILFNVTVNNVKSYNPDFYITYKVIQGIWNTTGPQNDIPGSYNFTEHILTPDNLKISDIPTNSYSLNYGVTGNAYLNLHRLIFKPEIISNIDPTCRITYLDNGIGADVEWYSSSPVPKFPTGPTGTRVATYTPIFHSIPTDTRHTIYSPTFVNNPIWTSYTGPYYVPVFPTGPTKTRITVYSPTFVIGPTYIRRSEYVPIFPTGPTKTKDINYVPVFVTGVSGVRRDEYTPTFVIVPTYIRVNNYSPVFPTGPTKTRNTEYVPIFVTGPLGVGRYSYTPTYIIGPTALRATEFIPKMPTGPTGNRIVTYEPIFKFTPEGYGRYPFTPTFGYGPTYTRFSEFVPKFPTGPIKIRSAQYVPIFRTPPTRSIV